MLRQQKLAKPLHLPGVDALELELQLQPQGGIIGGGRVDKLEESRKEARRKSCISI